MVPSKLAMAKRHADDVLITSSSSKRWRGPCSVDMRLESMAPSRSVSPPSLLALLGSRCRKRQFYCDDDTDHDLDLPLLRKGTHADLLKHTAHLNTVQQQTSGSFQERRNSAVAKSTNKRPREDSDAPADTTNPKSKAKVDAETTDPNEDQSYNSFQFWRTPLPELDMSLLQKLPQKDSDAMEA